MVFVPRSKIIQQQIMVTGLDYVVSSLLESHGLNAELETGPGGLPVHPALQCLLPEQQIRPHLTQTNGAG